MLVQAGLCRTCSETTLLVFPRDGSNIHDSELYLYEKMAKMLKNCSIHAILQNSTRVSYFEDNHNYVPLYSYRICLADTVGLV